MKKTIFVLTLALLIVLCSTALAWTCAGCGHEATLHFCNKCGLARPADNRCAQCGYASASGNFCAQCGSSLETEKAERSWPEISPQLTKVIFHPSGDNRVMAYCGPGDYHGAGAYKTMKMRFTYALFTDGTYTYIDMDYMTVGHRRVYFRNSAYPKSYREDIPEFDYAAHAAVTTAAVTPRWGPSTDYDAFEEAKIKSGTPLSVYFEEQGYVFCEFNCTEYGAVRAWIDADDVQAK